VKIVTNIVYVVKGGVEEKHPSCLGCFCLILLNHSSPFHNCESFSVEFFNLWWIWFDWLIELCEVH